MVPGKIHTQSFHLVCVCVCVDDVVERVHFLVIILLIAERSAKQTKNLIGIAVII